MQYSIMETPVGFLTLVVTDDGALTRLTMHAEPTMGEGEQDGPATKEAIRQLREYFDGSRQSFDLPLEPAGTEFQRTVWDALREIGYGQTRSYGQIAAAIGAPTASRAVGAANGKNPISIVVPCHRVIGSTGKLTGYAGGLERKTWLLNHERSVLDPGLSELAS